MPAGKNLIGAWTPLGTGTVTVNATTKAVTIAPANDATQTTARQQIATEVGKRYWVTYELQTSTQMWRNLGTTAGGGDVVASNVSTVNETKLSFVATTTSVWMDLARTAAGTTTVGSIRFEEAPTANASARRLNGRTQYFKLDAAASGLRTLNTLQYLGGWFKFQWLPTAAVYLLDFAVPDAVTSGGQSRARLFYDPTATKIAASNGGSAAGGNKYAENWQTASPGVDTWHYVGIILAADGGVQLVYDGTIGGTTIGTGVPEAGQYLGTLQLGSRNGSAPTNFAPVVLGDWVWCAGTLPTNPQIAALAAGNRPDAVAGFNPTYYWPMEQTTVSETSATAAAATLTANALPATVVGPAYVVPAPSEVFPLLFF